MLDDASAPRTRRPGHPGPVLWRTPVSPAVPGELVDPHDWSDEGIWHAGRLLRDLHDDDIAKRQNLPDATARAAHLRHFLDGYQLPTADRRDVVTTMIEYAIRDSAAEAIQAQVTPDQGDTAALWAIAWRARSAAWMIRHRHLLEHATTAAALRGACTPPAGGPHRA
jgi:hypothetical protein